MIRKNLSKISKSQYYRYKKRYNQEISDENENSDQNSENPIQNNQNRDEFNDQNENYLDDLNKSCDIFGEHSNVNSSENPFNRLEFEQKLIQDVKEMQIIHNLSNSAVNDILKFANVINDNKNLNFTVPSSHHTLESN